MSRLTAPFVVGMLPTLAISVLPLRGDTTISSNLNTSPPLFDSNTGDAHQVGLASQAEVAVGFQDPSASLSYLLTQLQVAANFSVSDPNSSTNPALNDLIVGLWQNTTNNPNTATELQSWDITAPGMTGNPGQLYTLTSAMTTIIKPNDFYFITENVTPDGSNTAEWGADVNNLSPPQDGLWYGTFGTPNSFSFQQDSGSCTDATCSDATPAYSVSGTAVTTPEPNGYGLMLLAGLGALLALRRRAGVCRVR
jgi:MYXO-CTERM domain-containing protein